MVQTGQSARRPVPPIQRTANVRIIVPHSRCMKAKNHLCGERVLINMCGNNSGLWIIIVLILLCSCGGFGYGGCGCGNGCGGNCGCSCGCENNCGNCCC